MCSKRAKGKMAKWQDGKVAIAVLPFCHFAILLWEQLFILLL